METKQLNLLLDEGLQELQLPLPELVRKQLIDYIFLLSKWNKLYNLTAIKEPMAMLIRHIFDSLSIAPYISGVTVMDVGSGAGLPGIPLALCFPEKQITLLDSNNKKTRFLTQAIAELPLKNASVIHSRVEQLKASNTFDCITTRAFAPLNSIIAQTQHLCRPGGHILAMCGAYPTPEARDGILDWNHKIYPLQVPHLQEKRHLLHLEKKQRG